MRFCPFGRGPAALFYRDPFYIPCHFNVEPFEEKTIAGV
jgi:hypothetical protein